MGCVHGVRIRFLSSIMQWVRHIIENLKCTIKRERVCVCSGHRRKWLIFFFHLSKLVISFEKRKNQFSILRFFDFALRCCWCYESFLHTSNIFYITFFFCCSLSVSLSSFHNFLWPANASPHTYIHCWRVLSWLRVFNVVSGTFAHSRTFDLVSSVFAWIFQQHFSAVHSISFRFYSSTLILLHSSFLIQRVFLRALLLFNRAFLGLWWFAFFFLQIWSTL